MKNALFPVQITLLIILFLLSNCKNMVNNNGKVGTVNIIEKEKAIEWWKDARFGMFIHWGLYSIPAGTWKDNAHDEGYSEWIMFDEKIPVKEYEKLTEQFNPAGFNATEWVRIAKNAGMKYIIITSKHHDGFAMYDSDISDYNISDATPFKRDVVMELADACRKEGLKFGCYYSVDRDWHHPLCAGNRYRQYHSIDAKYGYSEFSSGPFVDANSRMGRNPGDPDSTDPEGNLVIQTYTSREPSGGFLYVKIEPAGSPWSTPRIVFQMMDEKGTVNYSTYFDSQ